MSERLLTATRMGLSASGKSPHDPRSQHPAAHRGGNTNGVSGVVALVPDPGDLVAHYEGQHEGGNSSDEAPELRHLLRVGRRHEAIKVTGLSYRVLKRIFNANEAERRLSVMR